LVLLSIKGAAVVPEDPKVFLENVLFKGECRHRGEEIQRKLKKRRDSVRQARKRQPAAQGERFQQPQRAERLAAPSLKRILVEGILNIAERFRKLAPLTILRMEMARFETESQAKPADPCD
jgi:hypothetical protein